MLNMDRNSILVLVILTICLSYMMITSEVLTNEGPMKNTEMNPLGRVSILFFVPSKIYLGVYSNKKSLSFLDPM